MAVLANLGSLCLLPSFVSIVFAVVLFGSGIRSRRAIAAVTAAAFSPYRGLPAEAARQRTEQPNHSSADGPRADNRSRLPVSDDGDAAEAQARELRLYKELYYKLHNLEDHPDVLPLARRMLISLLSWTLAKAQQQQQQLQQLQQQLPQHGGNSGNGARNSSRGGDGSHDSDVRSDPPQPTLRPTILSVQRYTPAALARFMHDEHTRIEQQWESYLAQGRQHRCKDAAPPPSSSSSLSSPSSSPPAPASAPAPKMFADRAEAVWWLRQIAPVKFVDGAWLGHMHKISTPFALRRAATKDAWQVLSEELGDGDRQKHHVHVYEELLASLASPAAAAAIGQNARPKSHHHQRADAASAGGADANTALPPPQPLPPLPPPTTPLPPGHMADFVHARHALDRVCVWRAAVAQQLVSLFPHDFLPEVLGFNLHFEGVTLETLAAARELRELGIDPYYFVLHVSIDNADSGHTAIAMQTVVNYLEHVRRSSSSSSRSNRHGSADADGSGAHGDNDDDADDADAAEAAVQQAWKRVQAGFILSAGLLTTPCAAVLREQPAVAASPAVIVSADDAAAASSILSSPLPPFPLTSPSPSPPATSSSSSSSSSSKHHFPRSALEAEVAGIFRSKAAVSHKLHCSSRAKLGRRTLADWLAPDAAAAPHWPRAFLDALASSPPWVHRGRAAQSRLVAELSWRGRMFGSFTQREVDAVTRWIDSLDADDAAAAAAAAETVDGNDAEGASPAAVGPVSAVPSAPSVYAAFVGRSDADEEPAWHARDIRVDYPVLTPPPPHIAALLDDCPRPNAGNDDIGNTDDGNANGHDARYRYNNSSLPQDQRQPSSPPPSPFPSPSPSPSLLSATSLSPPYPPPPTTHGCGLASALAAATPNPARLLPLWFAHPCLLERFVCVPARTTSLAACAVVRLLRAQAGFDIEGPGVAGMDEVRRTDAGGLVELGLEMVARLARRRCHDDSGSVRHADDVGTVGGADADADADADFDSDSDSNTDADANADAAGGIADAPPPASFKEVLDRWPSDFALAMLHASMRPVANTGLLLGLAWAFVGLHELLADAAHAAPIITLPLHPALPPSSTAEPLPLSSPTSSSSMSSSSSSSSSSSLAASTSEMSAALSSSSSSALSSSSMPPRSSFVLTTAELLSPASKGELRLIACRERESLRVCMDELRATHPSGGGGGILDRDDHDRAGHWAGFCKGYALGRQHIERAFTL
jgi:phage terminase Nu1 subunit (DNA packaging protein)